MRITGVTQTSQKSNSDEFKKVYKPFLGIVLIAVLVRVVWAIAVPVIPVSDSAAYDTFALNLATGQGFGWNSQSPTAYWPVGTSFIYSIFYRIFGHIYFPIVIFNLCLSAAITWLSMLLAAVWFNRRVGIITGLLLALWPSQIQFTTVLASELPFTALVLVGLALWLYEGLNLWVRALFVGAVLAAASYVRPTALLIPILLLLFQWLYRRERLKTLAATVIMFAMMALLIAPWSIRNIREFGQFVTISTNGGANLWMGNNPNSTGAYMDLPPEVEKMNEAQRDRYLKTAAKSYIKEKPLLFLQRCITRLIDTHIRETIGVGWNEQGLVTRFGRRILSPLKLLSQLYWLPVLGLALVGIVLLGKQYGLLRLLTHPTVVLWGYFAAINSIIVAQDRYHFPSIPMIAMLAALSIVFFSDRKARKRQLQRSDFIPEERH